MDLVLLLMVNVAIMASMEEPDLVLDPQEVVVDVDIITGRLRQEDMDGEVTVLVHHLMDHRVHQDAVDTDTITVLQVDTEDTKDTDLAPDLQEIAMDMDITPTDHHVQEEEITEDMDLVLSLQEDVENMVMGTITDHHAQENMDIIMEVVMDQVAVADLDLVDITVTHIHHPTTIILMVMEEEDTILVHHLQDIIIIIIMDADRFHIITDIITTFHHHLHSGHHVHHRFGHHTVVDTVIIIIIIMDIVHSPHKCLILLLTLCIMYIYLC